VEEGSDHETSQILVDTTADTVYENRLRVRGREGGDYHCIVTGINSITSDPFTVRGMWHVVIHIPCCTLVLNIMAHGELYCCDVFLCIAEYVFQ